MGLMLDTCVLICAEKNRQEVDFDQWDVYGEVYISTITITELLIGVYRADTQARRLKRSAFVEAIIASIPRLDFTEKEARIHAEIYAYLVELGQIIGAHDLLIAATALTHGCALLTANHEEFTRVPGLEVIKF